MTHDLFQSPDVPIMLPELEFVQDADSTGYQFPQAEGWGILQGWFGGGLSDGIELIELCTGPLTVRILPTRGMGIWQAELNGLPIGWNSPVKQPVHPALVNLKSRNGLGWLDGFNELICRCGLSFVGPPGHDDGACSPVESEITLHGRVANIPAYNVSCGVSAEGLLQVCGIVDEATLFGPNLRMISTISAQVGSHSFQIRDEITNLRSQPAELQLLYHCNVGEPFLSEGSRLVCPAAVVAPRDERAAEGVDHWPHYLGPSPGYAEQAYFFEMQSAEDGRTLAMLKSPAGDLGFSVRYRPEQLPCFTQWKCTQAYQDGYVTGLEPGTNYPNFKAFERRQGRVRMLAPGETFVAELEFSVHQGREAVARIEAEIADMSLSAPRVYSAVSMPYSNVG